MTFKRNKERWQFRKTMQHLHINELNNCYRGNSEIIYLVFTAKYLEWFPSGRNYWDAPFAVCLRGVPAQVRLESVTRSWSTPVEFLPKSGWRLPQDHGQPQWSSCPSQAGVYHKIMVNPSGVAGDRWHQHIVTGRGTSATISPMSAGWL